VLPASIDFGYVFAHASFLDNPTLYTATIICIALYVLLAVFARFMDIKDSNRLGINLLPDNLPTHHYCYEINVFTGGRKEAATDSKVRFVLSGEEIDTGIRVMHDMKRSCFRRAGIDSFIMTTEK
jgi:polycystin 1L3